MKWIVVVLSAVVVLTAGCGGDSDGSAEQESTQQDQVAADESGEDSGDTAGVASGALSDDEIDAVLAGDERDEVLAPLLSLGFDEAAAECAMRAALGSGIDVLAEVDEELMTLFESCGVSVEQLAALGLGTTEDEVAEQLRLLTSVITPEIQEALRSSEEARAGTTALLVGQGFGEEEAACLIQALVDLEDLALLEDLDTLVGMASGCGLSLSDLSRLS